jgi:hypothetical protein
MNTHAQKQHLYHEFLFLLRSTARASGVALFAIWVWLLIAEVVRSGLYMPTVGAFGQAAMLAVVFAGYVVGWRNELAGGLLAILGTALFFALNLLLDGMLPRAEVVWFALPGVLYLLAWLGDERRDSN